MKKVILFLFAAALFAACNNQSNTPKELKGISLNKQTLELDMGDSYQLVVLYEPEDAEEGAPKVIWECTKERVATISATGRVEAKQKGRATIVATCGRFTAECKLEVVTGGSTPVTPPDPDKFSVTPTEIKAPAEGGTYTLTVKANIAWSATCEDDTWASISPDNGDGDATITVTVQPNTVEKADEQDITFTAGEFTMYVTIKRSAQAAVSKFVERPFSISDKQKVVFSQGNLQYHCKDQKWRFAELQYDYAGQNNRQFSDTYDGWIDLFSWGTGDDPTFLGGAGIDDKETFVDWGKNTISNGNGGGWYTMNDTCWKYIISERPNAATLKGFAMINGVNGCVLLPDQWEQPEEVNFTADATKYTDNQYSAVEWGSMEAAGAVFLPAAESRDVSTLTDKGGVFSSGWYWTNSPNGYDCCAYMVYFSEEAGAIRINSRGRSYGHSVRLVRNK